jgi:hypothetical protein
VAADLRGDLLGSSTDLSASEIRWLSPLPLWAGILAGPTAFALNLTATYALVHWTCASDRQSWLHLISLAAFVLVLGGSGISWLALQHAPASLDTEGGSPRARARFMALLGLASSAFFAFAVIANAYPQWVLDACQ